MNDDDTVAPLLFTFVEEVSNTTLLPVCGSGELMPEEVLGSDNAWFEGYWTGLVGRVSEMGVVSRDQMEEYLSNTIQRGGIVNGVQDQLSVLEVEGSDWKRRELAASRVLQAGMPSAPVEVPLTDFCSPRVLFGDGSEDGAAFERAPLSESEAPLHPTYPSLHVSGYTTYRSVLLKPPVEVWGNFSFVLGVSDGTAMDSMEISVEIIPADCGTFEAAPHSTVEFPEGTLYEAVAIQTCNAGYTRASAGFTKRCEWDSKWYGTTIRCIPVPVLPELPSFSGRGSGPLPDEGSEGDPSQSLESPELGRGSTNGTSACRWSWSSWTSWSPCFQRCGVEGWQYRRRFVNERKWYNEGEMFSAEHETFG